MKQNTQLTLTTVNNTILCEKYVNIRRHVSLRTSLMFCIHWSLENYVLDSGKAVIINLFRGRWAGGALSRPFPSLPHHFRHFPSFTLPSFRFLFSPASRLEVAPQIQLMDLGERCWGGEERQLQSPDTFPGL